MYNNTSYNPNILATVNKYLQFTTNFIAIDTKLRNLIDERESSLSKLIGVTMINSLSLFES